VKKGVRSVPASPGGYRFDRSSMDHRFDRGLTPRLPNVVQDLIEETRKKCKSLHFSSAHARLIEMISVDPLSVDATPLPFVGEKFSLDEVRFDFIKETTIQRIRLPQAIYREKNQIGDLATKYVASLG